MSEALHQGVVAVMHMAAQQAILPHFRQLSADQIIEKAADDLVTVADRESEAILADGLAKLLPEASIVGEEAAHADPALLNHLGDRLCWIIDPIDGTHNYAHGKSPFGIIIALAQAGETLAGWLYDPITRRLCSARKGEGAWVDGMRITARETGEAQPVAAISLHFMDAQRRADVQRRLLHCDVRLVDIPRCAAEQYPRLALGQNDLSVFERTLAWDHAAGVLFLNEAGGKAARPDGRAYRVDDSTGEMTSGGLLGASSPRLWEDAARALWG